MTRIHLNPDTPQTSQQQQNIFEDSLALAAATQLAGDIPFPSLDDDEHSENNSQNFEDIPGPSTSTNESEITPGAVVPFGQPPTSASAQFVPPPPPGFGGFVTTSVRPSKSRASSAHRGGSPMRVSSFVCKLFKTSGDVINKLCFSTNSEISEILLR